MEYLQKIWERVLAILKDELSEIAYKTWFLSLSPLECRDNVFLLSAPNEIHQNMITGKYLPLLQSAVEMASDQDLTVQVILQEEYVPNVQQKHHLHSSNLNPRYTFEEFVVGENNKYAHAACLAVAEKPAEVYNPLFLYGNSGLGKTHLIHSVGHYILDHNPNARVLYVTSEKFTNDLINSIKGVFNWIFNCYYVNILFIKFT